MKFRKFIEENFTIDDAETGQLVPFMFRDVQEKYYNLLIADYIEQDNFKGAREIILKARKEGFTSMVLALFCADIIHNVHPVRYLEISYKDDSTKQHFRRAKQYVISFYAKRTGVTDYKQLEKIAFRSINEGQEFVLNENGASFYVGTASGRTGERGGTVQGILFSESAHYPDTGILSASEIIEGTRNMLAVGSGMIFMETTANGRNHFWNTWGQAKLGDVDYKPRFFGWREFYTPEQFELIKAGFSDKSLIPQEYPETDEEAFIAHGKLYFNSNALKHYKLHVQSPITTGVIYT